MHTTNTPNGNPELLAVREQLKLHRLYLKLTMIRVQTKALQTLERLMDDPQPTGNEKTDKAKAIERNRQRLAANQTLIHCRTAQRERRLAKTTNEAIRKQKELEPNRASDGWQASKKNMPTDSLSPRGRRWQPTEGRMTDEGAVDASDQSPSGCTTDPSTQPSPDHFQTAGEGATPPSPLAGEGGRASGRMRGRPESSNDQSTPSKGAMVGAEGAGHADSSAQPRPPHGLRPISDRTQTMPPKLIASNKFIKPKHPRRSRKRKQAR